MALQVPLELKSQLKPSYCICLSYRLNSWL